MKNEDKWVESFRERLKDYSEPLPKGLWDKIETDLYNEKPKVLSLRRYWMPVAAAIAIMAITSLTVWLMKLNKMDTIYDSLSVVEKVQGEDKDVVVSDKSLLLIEEEKRLAYSSEKVKGKFEKIKENQSLSAHEFQSLSYEEDQGKASPERDETVGLFSEGSIKNLNVANSYIEVNSNIENGIQNGPTMKPFFFTLSLLSPVLTTTASGAGAVI